MPDLINEYWTQTRQDEETFEVDWPAEYAIQRKDRMHDAIEDYLNDEKVDARRAYEEMLSCIDNTIQVRKKQLNSKNSCSDIDQSNLSIPSHLEVEWESYLDVCASFGIEPNKRRFLRYNELFPYK